MASRIHGGPQDHELRWLGVDPARLLDFSVSTNPYGPCASVTAAVRGAALDRYPDPTGRAVRDALARWLDLAADQIVLGNGAAELLWALARALLGPADTALVVEPTFCELRAAVRALGATVHEWRATAADRFRIDLRAIAARARSARLIYLCVPNTPTGVALPAAEIAAWAATLPHATLVLDQSFLSLSDRAADAAVAMPPNVVRVRSLTKDHAIAGVRVGYLLADPAIAARVERQRPAWSTSAMAQAAALATIGEPAFVEDSRQRLRVDRDRTTAQLRALGLAPLPSAAPFVLVPVPGATALRARLLARHGILVRDCASFGLPDHVRIAARPPDDSARLVTALREELLRC
jgi:histidinol-phosphate aminotransferase